MCCYQTAARNKMKKNLITLAVLTLVTVVVLNACSPIQPSGKEGTTATLVRTQAVKVTIYPSSSNKYYLPNLLKLCFEINCLIIRAVFTKFQVLDK